MEPIIEKHIQVKDRKIALTAYQNKGPVIIVVHGFQAHRKMEMVASMAEKVHKSGCTAVTWDMSGHGDSEGSFSEFTITHAIEELNAVIADAKANFPGRKIGIVGNSQGGMVAMLAASKDATIKAVVLHAPVSDFQDAIQVAGAKMIQAMGMEGKTTPEALIQGWKARGAIIYPDSHNNLVPLNYSFYEDGMRHSVMAAARRINAPVLLIHGKNDETVPLAQSLALAKTLKLNRKSFRQVPNGLHEFTGSQLEEYTEAASAFLQAHLGH